MNNKEKLEKNIREHARYWDCYSDAPTEINHTGKLMKLFRINSVAFAVFLRENYSTQERWENVELENGKWRNLVTDEILDIREIYKLWENEK